MPMPTRPARSKVWAASSQRSPSARPRWTQKNDQTSDTPTTETITTRYGTRSTPATIVVAIRNPGVRRATGIEIIP